MANLSSKLMLNTLKGQCVKNSHTPVWLMRQAGRYLPEYHKTRNQAGSFLNLCYNPKLASEVTLQPIRRFDFDASIVFSDILVIPDALGQKVDFIEGVGPVLENISNINEIPENFDVLTEKLNPVYETLDILKTELPKTTTLIGFAGAPWTIATYMIASNTNDKLSISLQKLKSDNEFSDKLFNVLIKSISLHLINQVKAGAEVLQIFDSWAGFLNDKDYIKYSVGPITEIINNVKKVYPDTPIIVFKRGEDGNEKEEKFIKLFNTGADCISINDNINSQYIIDNLKDGQSIQGNLNSDILKSGKNLKYEIIKILDDFKNVAHIFNLAHGIDKETPIENVELLVKTIKEYK